jgi:hypothetical protein
LSIQRDPRSDRGRQQIRHILRHLLGAVAIARPLSRSARLLAAVTILMTPSMGRADSSQCTDVESVLFTCRSGNSVVSVCASQLSADAGLVQYRFGPEGAPNIRFPLAAQDWRTSTRAGMLTFAGGGGAYVAFKSEPYRYVVYTAIGRGWGEKAGVAVEKNGKLVSNLLCTQKPASELGPDLFRNARFPDDSEGFDLP